MAYFSQSLLGKLRSENCAGIVSFIGSLILLVASDVPSYYAVALFFVAEGVLLYRGHRTDGYALACFMFALGDFLLVFSSATAGNTPVHIALMVQACIWLLGTLRLPLEVSARRFGALQGYADNIQYLVGILNLIQRMPLLLCSFLWGSWVMLVAAIFWSAADVLTGRLHQLAAITARRWFGANLVI